MTTYNHTFSYNPARKNAIVRQLDQVCNHPALVGLQLLQQMVEAGSISIASARPFPIDEYSTINIDSIIDQIFLDEPQIELDRGFSLDNLRQMTLQVQEWILEWSARADQRPDDYDSHPTTWRFRMRHSVDRYLRDHSRRLMGMEVFDLPPGTESVNIIFEENNTAPIPPELTVPVTPEEAEAMPNALSSSKEEYTYKQLVQDFEQEFGPGGPRAANFDVRHTNATCMLISYNASASPGSRWSVINNWRPGTIAEQTIRWRASQLNTPAEKTYTMTETHSDGTTGIVVPHDSAFEKMIIYRRDKTHRINNHDFQHAFSMLEARINEKEFKNRLSEARKKAEELLMKEFKAKAVDARKKYDSEVEKWKKDQEKRYKEDVPTAPERVLLLADKPDPTTMNGNIFFLPEYEAWKWRMLDAKSGQVVALDVNSSKLLNTMRPYVKTQPEDVETVREKLKSVYFTKMPEALNMLKADAERAEEVASRPIFDIGKWEDAGFRVVPKYENMKVELYYNMEGFRFLDKYFVPVRSEIRFIVNLRSQVVEGVNAKSPDSEKYHPHINSASKNSWAGCCTGSFGGDFKEAIFGDGEPSDLISMIKMYYNNYHVGGAYHQIPSLNWPVAFERMKDGSHRIVERAKIKNESNFNVDMKKKMEDWSLMAVTAASTMQSKIDAAQEAQKPEEVKASA